MRPRRILRKIQQPTVQEQTRLVKQTIGRLQEDVNDIKSKIEYLIMQLQDAEDALTFPKDWSDTALD